MQLIDPKRAETVFRQTLESYTTAGSNLRIEDALQAVLAFYKAYGFTGVEVSEPDNDMLLFEYGVWSHREPYFSVDFIRQFSIEDEQDNGYQQLSLTLCYAPEPFGSIADFNSWSANFDSVESWARHLQTTAGYQQMLTLPATSFAIGLDLT